MQRGIGLSPWKNKSAKDKGKFKRGGLAERAQHLISCSKTDHTLWHRQLEQALSSSLSLPSYDMRFRILRVLPLPAKVPTPTGVHLAVCRISSRHKLVGVLGEPTDQCFSHISQVRTGSLKRGEMSWPGSHGSGLPSPVLCLGKY